MPQQIELLKQLFQVAVQQALPENCMPEYLQQMDNTNETCVLGAGKASMQMAEAAVQHFGDQCYGVVVTRHGYTQQQIGRIKILTAGHPIPDAASAEAARQVLQMAKATPEDVPVLFLISGGGSALMSMPIPGLPLAEKMAINRFLLACGASIDEINLVRKQLSAIKGGKLAQALKGQHQSLIISDVVGDPAELIASGPTVTDHSTPQQALAILQKYHWPRITFLQKLLLAQAKEPLQNQGLVHIIANAKQSLDKAAETAKKQGWHPLILDYAQQGEAKHIAEQHAKIAMEKYRSGQSCILLSGGELTVTLSNTQGAGGPNQEYLLALAIALKGHSGIYALACDTDGIDGNKDVAGAYIQPDTLTRAAELQLAPDLHLQRNLSYNFFKQLDNLIITGPTHTNVNDFRAILIKAG